MELGEVAEIIIGALINREQKLNGENTYKVFSMKNFESEKKEYEIINTIHTLDKQLTQKNDIIFRLVYPNKMVYIKEAEEENLLVSSQMCIIRPNPEKLNAVFLKWYLESTAGLEKLKLNVTGSAIQKISVTSLRKIKIPNLDLETQKKLSDLIELWEKEKSVLKTIMNRKDNLYNCIIEETILEKEKKD